MRSHGNFIRVTIVDDLERRVMMSAQLFAAPLNFPAGGAATWLAAADFDGDDDSDLATVNYQSPNGVSILRGDGGGMFSAPTGFGGPQFPRSIISADFDEDGIIDLAYSSEPETIRVARGLGNGTFVLSLNTYSTIGTPRQLAAADLNLDGHLDLAVANVQHGRVTILLGSGTGAFSVLTQYNVGTQPVCLTVADFDGNGLPDIVVGNFSSGSGSILLATGGGFFASQQPLDTGLNAEALVTADLNGDGHQDIAVANFGPGTLSTLLGNGDGTFASRQTWNVGGNLRSLAVADFDRDGNLDLITTGKNQTTSFASLLLGNGAGVFGPRVNFSIGNQSVEPAFVIVSNFNGDDWPDIATANFGNSTISVLLNQGELVLPPRAVSTSLQIDAPTVNFHFDKPIDPASVNTSDLEVTSLSNGTQSAATSVFLSGDAKDVSFALPTNLSDGDYRFRLPPGVLTGVNGVPTDVAIQLQNAAAFLLAGDANRDRTVNISDFAILAARFNLPGTFSQGDFNYDGVTSISDFAILASKFNTTLPAPSDLPKARDSSRTQYAASFMGGPTSVGPDAVEHRMTPWNNERAIELVEQTSVVAVIE